MLSSKSFIAFPFTLSIFHMEFIAVFSVTWEEFDFIFFPYGRPLFQHNLLESRSCFSLPCPATFVVNHLLAQVRMGLYPGSLFCSIGMFVYPFTGITRSQFL